MWRQRSDIRKRFLTIFLSGFAAGVLYMVVFGRAVVHETTLLSRYFFRNISRWSSLPENCFLPS